MITNDTRFLWDSHSGGNCVQPRILLGVCFLAAEQNMKPARGPQTMSFGSDFTFYCGLKPQEMTVYTNSQYEWQNREQIGDLFNNCDWLLLQRRDQFGYMFTRVAYKNNVLTKQWLVFKSRTIWVDDDSESDWGLGFYSRELLIHEQIV